MLILNKKKQNFIALLVLLIAFAARMYVWLNFSGNQNNFLQPDTMSYLLPGMQLLEKGVFPSFSRTPVYPVVLAGISKYLSSNYAFLAFMQILLSLVTVWLSYILSLRIFGFFTAIICMLFLALDFQSMLTANFLLSETLFTLILTVFMVRTGSFCQKIEENAYFDFASIFVLGGYLSILSMCRPISCALFTVISIWMFFVLKSKRKMMLIVLFCVSSVSLTILWGIRNYSHTGVFFFTTISSENIYAYRAAWNAAYTSKRKFDNVHHEFKKISDEKQKRELLNAGEIAEWKKKEGINILKRNPILTVWQGVRGMTDMYLDITSFHEFDIGKMSILSIIMILYRVLHILLLYSGISISAVLIVKGILSEEQRKMLLLSFITIAYFTFFSAGVEAYGRFRVPIVPLLSMSAAVGWTYLFKKSIPLTLSKKILVFPAEKL